ncbi:MAG: AAA family ATPase [Actinomycetota bacterium]
MRPVTIDMQGFGVFRDRTIVDLADAELFAIVGKTGDGKSTIIDAVCFSLYGKVARYEKGDVAPVITIGAAEVKVSYTFELAQRRYVATRIARRNPNGSGAKTRAARLEVLAADGTTEVLAGSVGELDESVRRLVGLDFGQFTKCVVLPQGEFAAFLHARTGERAAILGALLDLGRYDRMASRARVLAGEAKGEREGLERELARTGADDVAIAGAARRAESFAALQLDLERAAPDDAKLAQGIAIARAESSTARVAVEALDAVVVPDRVRKLTPEADAARAAARAASLTADATEQRANDLEAVLIEMPPGETLNAARDAHDEYGQVAARIETGASVVADRRTAAEAARESLLAAQARVADAEQAADTANRQHAHAELRATLVAGEPCPVCAQPVARVPRKASTAQLTRARTRLEADRAKLRTAEHDGQEALSALHRAEAQLAALRERGAQLAVKVTDYPDRVALDARLERRRTAQRAAHEAHTQAARARAAAKGAGTRVTNIERALHDLEATLQAQRDAVVSAGLTPPPLMSATDIVSRWEQLAEFAVRTTTELEKRAAEQDDFVRALAAERDALVGELRHRADELGATAARTTVVDILAAVVAGARDAVHEVDRLRQAQTRARELERESDRARRSEHVAHTLSRLLDKGHFGQWLVDAALRTLLDGASVVLQQLTAGQYSLRAADDGELLVVDHVNADETRSVRSLSGGETFQASLALALALADRIAELAAGGAAALESIFLDEGFGTLDPESLDIVAGTIESLASRERVVGVVTHVPELAERMPVRLRVRKVGHTSVVTRESA